MNADQAREAAQTKKLRKHIENIRLNADAGMYYYRDYKVDSVTSGNVSISICDANIGMEESDIEYFKSLGYKVYKAEPNFVLHNPTVSGCFSRQEIIEKLNNLRHETKFFGGRKYKDSDIDNCIAEVNAARDVYEIRWEKDINK